MAQTMLHVPHSTRQTSESKSGRATLHLDKRQTQGHPLNKIKLAALAISAALANGPAFALPTTECGDVPAEGKSAAFLISLGNYDHGANPDNGCIQHDKIFSNFTFTFTDNIAGLFEYAALAGVATHIAAFPLTGVSNGASFTVSYDIDIAPAAVTDGFRFWKVSAGATFTNGDGVSDFRAVDNNGNTYDIETNGGVLFAVGNPIWMQVTHSGTSAVGGTVQNLSETFQQRNPNVPEIGALTGTGALTLLVGALALTGERRRNRQA